MRKVCAWCGLELEGSTEASSKPISHGICAECAEVPEYEDSPVRLTEFLESLEGPVMLLDGRRRVRGANAEALAVVDKQLELVRGFLAGEVFECVYSYMAEGCGRTIHCTGCAMRAAVDTTRTTGEGIERQLAFQTVSTPEGVVRVDYRVSAELVGGLVLLRVDEASPAPAPEGDHSPDVETTDGGPSVPSGVWDGKQASAGAGAC